MAEFAFWVGLIGGILEIIGFFGGTPRHLSQFLVPLLVLLSIAICIALELLVPIENEIEGPSLIWIVIKGLGVFALYQALTALAHDLMNQFDPGELTKTKYVSILVSIVTLFGLCFGPISIALSLGIPFVVIPFFEWLDGY